MSLLPDTKALVDQEHSSIDSKISIELMRAYSETPNLVSLYDRNDMLVWANSAFRQAYGLGPEQFTTWADMMLYGYEHGIGTVIHTDNIHAWLASACSRRGKQPFRAFEAALLDGRWIWMSETVRDDGSMLCIACDISSLHLEGRDLRMERDMAKRASLTDSLTGISNRTHMIEQLATHLDLVRTQDEFSCGIAIMDLDFFKKINDRFGHPGGDTVLQHFAKTVRHNLRREDGFGRIGGEEFMILLPNMCLNSFSQRMQHILDVLPSERPLAKEPEFSYTCSAGGSLLQPDDSIDSVIQRVDSALYAAKAQGRNRLIIAEQEELWPPEEAKRNSRNLL